jgi:outer membrane protein TolC
LKRFEIGTISQEDLFTLQLDKINSRNEVQNAMLRLRRARLNLYSLLRLPVETEITLIFPQYLPQMEIQSARALDYAIQHNPELLDHRQRLLESERQVEQARKESRINASIDASFGLSQIGNSLSDAYRNPMDQEVARFTINIPIVDWGLAKGRYNLAQKNLQVLGASIQQARIDFEHDILMTVEEFNLQQSMVAGAAEAENVAHQAFEIAKRRYINGNIQLTQLNALQQNTIAARRAYVNALEIYWRYYFTIRRMTLYDFANDVSLADEFEIKYGL